MNPRNLFQRFYAWIQREAEENGVNPFLFAVLWIGTLPLFTWGVADVVSHRAITFWGFVILALSYIIPYGYVFVFGRPKLKIKLYLLAIALWGFYSLSQRIELGGTILVFVMTVVVVAIARYVWGKRK